MNTPPIVSPEEWIAAREKLLVKEKEHMRAGDALAAERRRMPRWPLSRSTSSTAWTAAEHARVFDGRRQLVVYRAFYARTHHLPRKRAAPTRSGPASVAR